MKYKCYECGHVFNEEDADTRKDYVGEFWGAPAYQDLPICPNCGSEELDEYTGSDNEEDSA